MATRRWCWTPWSPGTSACPPPHRSNLWDHCYSYFFRTWKKPLFTDGLIYRRCFLCDWAPETNSFHLPGKTGVAIRFAHRSFMVLSYPVAAGYTKIEFPFLPHSKPLLLWLLIDTTLHTLLVITNSLSFPESRHNKRPSIQYTYNVPILNKIGFDFDFWFRRAPAVAGFFFQK